MSDQQQTPKLLEIDLNAVHDDEDDEEQSLQPSLSPPSPSSSSSSQQPLSNDHFQNSLEQKLLELSTKRKQLTQKLSRLNEQIVFYEQLKHQHYQQQHASSSQLLTIPSNERSNTPDTPHIIPEIPQSTLTHIQITKMEPSCALLSQNVLIDHPLSSLITNNHDETITKTEAITTTTIQNSSASEDQVTTQPSIMIDDSQQTTKEEEEEEEHCHHSLTSSISSPPIRSTIIDNQLDHEPMLITSVNDSQEDIPLIVMDSPDKLHLSSSLSTTTITNKKRNRTENDQTLQNEEVNEEETTTPKKKFARLRLQRENNNNKHEADVDAPNEKMSVKQSTPKKRTLRRPRPTTRSPTSKTLSSPTNVSPKPSITISPKISNSPLLEHAKSKSIDYSSEDSDNVTQTKKISALNSNNDDDHETTNNEDGVTGFGDGDDDDDGKKDTNAITNDENKVIVIHNGNGPTSDHMIDNNDNDDDDEGNSEEEIMFVAPCLNKKNESSSSLSSTPTKTSNDNGSIEFDDSDDNNDDEKRVETASQQTKRRGRLATLRKRKSLSQVDKRKNALDQLSKRTKLQSSQAHNNNDDSDTSDGDYTLSSSGEQGVDDNAVNVIEEAKLEEETAPKRRRVVRNKHHKRTGNMERLKVGLDDFIVSSDEEIEFESPDELDKVVEEKVVEVPSLATQSAKITFVSKEGRHVEKEVFTQQLEKEESEDDEENRDSTVSSPEISSGYTSVKSAPFLLRPTTTLSVKGAFMTTCQYFAYSAIYPEWERDVLKDDEKRNHYQPCLIKILDTVSSIKESLAASSVWTSELCEEIKQRTFFHHQDFFASSDECCDVCRRSNHEPTFAVSLSGDIIDQGFYSRYTACNPNKYIIQKAPKPYKFVSARICFARVSVYHIMHHYKYFLVRKLKSLISSIKKTEDADVMIQIENSNTFPLLYHGFNTMLSYAEAMSSPRWTRNSSDTTYSTRLWNVLPINRIQASKTATSNVETSQSDQPLTGEQPSTSDQEDANREMPPSPVEMPASPVLFSTQDPTPSQVTVSFPLIETKQEETESEGKEKENHVDKAEDNEEEEDDMCILLSDDEDEAMEQN